MAEHAYTIAARVLTAGDSSPKWIAGCIGDDSIALTADAAWKSLEGKLCIKSALAEQELPVEFSSDDSAPTASVSASVLDQRVIAAPGDLKIWVYAEGDDYRIQTDILTDVIEGFRASEYAFDYPVNIVTETVSFGAPCAVTVYATDGEHDPEAVNAVFALEFNEAQITDFATYDATGEDPLSVAAGIKLYLSGMSYTAVTATVGEGSPESLTQIETGDYTGYWPFTIPADSEADTTIVFTCTVAK